MFGFLKKMFAGGAASAPSESMEYKGYTITACPIPEGGHNYRVCGVISKDGQEKKFIRSDLIPDPKMACDITMDKAMVIINQQGDKIFKLNNI
ncbi:HlyU family transcriptional regulator [Gynuella sp.]|uniref:HlyU family transcriptional regulator n=1 Tax=Gynuella sp. TaxID=2969146 RepID=UPI003D0EBBDA